MQRVFENSSEITSDVIIVDKFREHILKTFKITSQAFSITRPTLHLPNIIADPVTEAVVSENYSPIATECRLDSIDELIDKRTLDFCHPF